MAWLWLCTYDCEQWDVKMNLNHEMKAIPKFECQLILGCALQVSYNLNLAYCTFWTPDQADAKQWRLYSDDEDNTIWQKNLY